MNAGSALWVENKLFIIPVISRSTSCITRKDEHRRDGLKSCTLDGSNADAGGLGKICCFDGTWPSVMCFVRFVAHVTVPITGVGLQLLGLEFDPLTLRDKARKHHRQQTQPKAERLGEMPRQHHWSNIPNIRRGAVGSHRRRTYAT